MNKDLIYSNSPTPNLVHRFLQTISRYPPLREGNLLFPNRLYKCNFNRYNICNIIYLYKYYPYNLELIKDI